MLGFVFPFSSRGGAETEVSWSEEKSVDKNKILLFFGPRLDTIALVYSSLHSCTMGIFFAGILLGLLFFFIEFYLHKKIAEKF